MSDVFDYIQALDVWAFLLIVLYLIGEQYLISILTLIVMLGAKLNKSLKYADVRHFIYHWYVFTAGFAVFVGDADSIVVVLLYCLTVVSVFLIDMNADWEQYYKVPYMSVSGILEVLSEPLSYHRLKYLFYLYSRLSDWLGVRVELSYRDISIRHFDNMLIMLLDRGRIRKKDGLFVPVIPGKCCLVDAVRDYSDFELCLMCATEIADVDEIVKMWNVPREKVLSMLLIKNLILGELKNEYCRKRC